MQLKSLTTYCSSFFLSIFTLAYFSFSQSIFLFFVLSLYLSPTLLLCFHFFRSLSLSSFFYLFLSFYRHLSFILFILTLTYYVSVDTSLSVNLSFILCLHSPSLFLNISSHFLALSLFLRSLRFALSLSLSLFIVHL